MAFSELELMKIEKVVGTYCRDRVPAHHWDKLRMAYRVNGHDVVVFEVRPDWQDPTRTMEEPIAKFKFVRASGEWRLFWMRADLKWHKYEPFPASSRLEKLVEAVDQDRYCCFFG